ncbi:hypothetical protein niasHT_017079 [Heterodera trifolii]|uniref:PB1 domain-containing protein n=1 Tax=Heterodera trifolii TaxID=157864 RepID=A0ABD2KYU6_9BILA
MAPVQIKWLHCDGFRRFELEEPTYAALVEAIRSRIATFQGGLCYTDAEGDKILITCDLDFADMVKYFKRKSAGSNSELVIKIQTNDGQNGDRNPGESPAVTSSTSLAKQKHKIEVIELLESADESNSIMGEAEGQSAQIGTNDKSEERPMEMARKGIAMENHDGHRDGPIPSMNEFMREMVKIDDDICHISHQKQIDLAHQPGHSSWFVSPSEFHANLSWPLDGEVMSTTNVVRENGPNERVDNTTPIGNNLMDLGHRMWSNRKSVARLISCTRCGAGVTNEHSSLKLHVNLHHLKLPIFSCKYCWKVEHKFSRANMLRHMRREHAERAETDFDHNSGKYRVELYAKIDECFPEAAAERKRRTATDQ